MVEERYYINLNTACVDPLYDTKLCGTQSMFVAEPQNCSATFGTKCCAGPFFLMICIHVKQGNQTSFITHFL